MDNREVILDTALDLFYMRGYDAVGVQEIAERSGVTKPTLYYYFKSKYGLLEQLLARDGQPFLQQFHEACTYTGDLRSTLSEAARVLFALVERTPKFYSLFISLYYSPRENEAYQAVHPMIVQLQQETEQIFIAAAGLLGNMRGRQRQFSLGYIGLLLTYIGLKMETCEGQQIRISQEEIDSLVHQFMHGIYS